MDIEARITRGRETAQKLLGEERWNRVEAGLQQQHPDLAAYILEWAYGEVYQRGGLDLRSREIVSIVCLTMLRLADPLKTHVVMGRQVGLSEEEINEIFVHMSMFAGFPTALFGSQVAKEVLSPKPE